MHILVTVYKFDSKQYSLHNKCINTLNTVNIHLNTGNVNAIEKIVDLVGGEIL